VPIGSDAEPQTLERAFNNLAAAEFHKARTHPATPPNNSLPVLTTHGKSAWKIGKILNVSTRTAGVALAKVTKKFGAVRIHAVMLCHSVPPDS
jgi:hypothetical protein